MLDSITVVRREGLWLSEGTYCHDEVVVKRGVLVVRCVSESLDSDFFFPPGWHGFKVLSVGEKTDEARRENRVILDMNTP